MVCNCSNIDTNAICDAARQLLRKRFEELLQNIPCTHTNKDAYYSPSQYWFDLARTDRRTVSTSMSVGLRGTTIVISLSYA